jgi:uncharacterized protein YndB with AHSA1/START domain
MSADGYVLRLDRSFPATREEVWRALTDAEALAEWWGPNGFTSPSVDFEPAVGGGYHVVMQPPEGEPFHLSGTFREVDPPSRLAYTFVWDPPDPDDRETTATLVLEDQREETKVLFTQAAFATEERRSLHEDGWTEGFERLEALLRSSRRAGSAPPD